MTPAGRGSFALGSMCSARAQRRSELLARRSKEDHRHDAKVLASNCLERCMQNGLKQPMQSSVGARFTLRCVGWLPHERRSRKGQLGARAAMSSNPGVRDGSQQHHGDGHGARSATPRSAGASQQAGSSSAAAAAAAASSVSFFRPPHPPPCPRLPQRPASGSPPAPPWPLCLCACGRSIRCGGGGSVRMPLCGPGRSQRLIFGHRAVGPHASCLMEGRETNSHERALPTVRVHGRTNKSLYLCTSTTI
jgi:hypothetical protein